MAGGGGEELCCAGDEDMSAAYTATNRRRHRGAMRRWASRGYTPTAALLWRQMSSLMTVAASHYTKRHHRMGLLPKHQLPKSAYAVLKYIDAREVLHKHNICLHGELAEVRRDIKAKAASAGRHVQALINRCTKVIQQYNVDNVAGT